MRKLLIALTVLMATTTILVGCGGDTPSTGPSATVAPAAATIAPAATAASAATTAPGTTAPAATAKPAVNYPPPIPAGATVNIVFENYNLASAGVGRDATQQLIDEFNAANPQIKVEGRGTNNNDIVPKAQAQVVAGTPPDILQAGFRHLDFIATTLQGQALENIVPPDELAAWKGGPYPMSPNGLKLAELNGKTYGVPYTFSTPTLFYNADLFTAAGLDPAKPPTTWTEVKQAALAIKAKTNKEGVVIDCLGTADWCWQALVRSNGGRVMSEDRKSATFAQPESVGAATMWQDLVQSGAHPPLASSDASTAFQGGNLSMVLTTSALQASFVNGAKGKFTLRAAKMPSFAGKAAVPTNSGAAIYILAKDPLKQRAAWEFMKFMTSERAYTVITSKIGYLPLRTGIVNDDKYLKPWVTENPLVQPNLEQLEKLEPWVAFPGNNYQQCIDLMMKAVEQVAYTGAPAEATMKAAQERVTGLFPKR